VTESNLMPSPPEPRIAFPADEEPRWDPVVSIHVNFGVLAARQATPAEIDRLAVALLDRLERVTIVSEVHYEVDRHSEAAVHQIRVEAGPTEGGREGLQSWLIDQAEQWARTCARSRV
jgi:hypothetical protein